MTAYALCQLQHAYDHVVIGISTLVMDDRNRSDLDMCSAILANEIYKRTSPHRFAVVIPHRGNMEVKYQKDVTANDRASGTVIENLSFTDAFNASVGS